MNLLQAVSFPKSDFYFYYNTELLNKKQYLHNKNPRKFLRAGSFLLRLFDGQQ